MIQMKYSICILLICCKSIYGILLDQSPMVKTRLGRVKGLVSSSQNGNLFYAFKNIPFAQPPIGNLRFKPPQKPLPWNGILDGTKEVNPCIQKNYLFAKPSVEGTEDCLYLNIYTRQVHTKEVTSHLPVMVFIHWGGFFTGYSSSNYLGPEYFMNEEIVLVTFNYRLGALGFLSTNDDAAPGNYGLKDQLAALEWIQSNIEYFGGNRKKVTLFGQSAGGASVHYHLLSPLSKGLFHQAISQSGTALALWAKPLESQQLEIAQLQAKFVGCGHTVNNSQSLVECLRRIDAEDLIKSGDKFKYFSVDPLTVYVPSVEKETPLNRRPFITKQPIEYIRRGEFQNVPWILGMVSDEGIIRAAPLLTQSTIRKTLNQEFNKLMPVLMALFMSTPKEHIFPLWEKIRNYYFDGESAIDVNSSHSIQKFVNLYTDRSFAYTLYQTVLLHSIKSRNPAIWLYNFNYRGEHSYGKVFAASTEDLPNYKWGVSHCDELLYLFKTPALFPKLSHHQDKFVSRLLVRLWANFATFGDPTPSTLPPDQTFNISWSKVDTLRSYPSTNKNMYYLNITGAADLFPPITTNMQHEFYTDRFKFWENLPLMENVEDLHQNSIDF